MSEIFICRREAVAVEKNPFPTYTYTGQSLMIDDGDGNWRIKFLTSGELTFTKIDNEIIDVFLVGGGGGGTYGRNGGYAGSGGGGGYTSNAKSMPISMNTSYEIIIGSGGAGSVYNTTNNSNYAGAGGATSAFGISAAGGSGGWVQLSSSGHSAGGGNGGSGGGGYGAAGGRDGGNGSTGSNPYISISGGKGQGSTTREFAEPDGDLYANGGGYSETTNVTFNTGNGGDGRSAYSLLNGMNGASGIVVIRNAR